jgi:hypothetical protein
VPTVGFERIGIYQTLKMPGPNNPIAPALDRLLTEEPPSDYSAWELDRFKQLQCAARLVRKGYPVKVALSLAGGPSMVGFYRQVAAYRAKGLEGLKAGYANCGRPKNWTPALIRLAIGWLAIRTIEAEVSNRLNLAEIEDADSEKARAAASSLLREAGIATLPDSEVAEILLEQLHGGNSLRVPAELRPHIETAVELAGQVIFGKEAQS